MQDHGNRGEDGQAGLSWPNLSASPCGGGTLWRQRRHFSKSCFMQTALVFFSIEMTLTPFLQRTHGMVSLKPLRNSDRDIRSLVVKNMTIGLEAPLRPNLKMRTDWPVNRPIHSSRAAGRGVRRASSKTALGKYFPDSYALCRSGSTSQSAREDLHRPQVRHVLLPCEDARSPDCPLSTRHRKAKSTGTFTGTRVLF